MTSAPQAISDYNLRKTLGTGTYGKVVLATMQATGQYCAIKVLDKEHVVQCKQVEHTLSERALLSELKCPFIVQMLTSFKVRIQ